MPSAMSKDTTAPNLLSVTYSKLSRSQVAGLALTLGSYTQLANTSRKESFVLMVEFEPRASKYFGHPFYSLIKSKEIL